MSVSDPDSVAALSGEADNVFRKHDHRKCRAGAMEEARKLCVARGVRLTPTRERVLDILLESHQALGAYDILERLHKEGRPGQPPVVYRALEFLVAQGFVHRLERLNAFAACAHGADGHEPLFLICSDCRQVAEAPLGALSAEIDHHADALGFSAQSRVVEVLGLCPSCREAAA